MVRPILVVLLLVLPASGLLQAQQRAGDSAQNYPTTSGSGVWNPGDNFGFGFEPWQFITSGSGGMFLGNSTQNGGNRLGDPGSSGGINSPNLRAWGLFGNNGGTATAIRPFSSALLVGETFQADFDNGYIDNGSRDGISLATSSGIVLWQLSFVGGENTYRIFDSRGSVATTLPFTDGGMHIEFTLTSPLSYTATVTLNSGPSETISGALATAGAIERFEVFNQNAGFNSSNNAYANNLAIVPEPSTFGLIAMGALLTAGCVNRRRR